MYTFLSHHKIIASEAVTNLERSCDWSRPNWVIYYSKYEILFLLVRSYHFVMVFSLHLVIFSKSPQFFHCALLNQLTWDKSNFIFTVKCYDGVIKILHTAMIAQWALIYSAYLALLLESCSPAQSLRSFDKNLLTAPWWSLTLSAEANHVSASTVWNLLLDNHNHHHHHNRFMDLFPGPPGWAGARRELLDFMVQRKINRGRHTGHPAGCNSIRTNQCPPPPSSAFFFTGQMPFLPRNQQCQSTEGK